MGSYGWFAGERLQDDSGAQTSIGSWGRVTLVQRVPLMALAVPMSRSVW